MSLKSDRLELGFSVYVHMLLYKNEIKVQTKKTLYKEKQSEQASVCFVKKHIF